MISKLFNAIFGEKTYLKFKFGKNGVIDIKFNIKPGDEKLFAETIYSLTTGMYSEFLINSIKTSLYRRDKVKTFAQFIEYINEMIKIEQESLQKLLSENNIEQGLDNRPVVEPMNLFTDDEDEDEEL